MTPGEVDDAVQAAAAAALAALGGDPADAAGRAGVRRPRHPEQGDYASPVALRLAKVTGISARELAGVIADGLGRHPGVRRAETGGPGFVSIWLTPQASGDLAGVIVADGQAYGRNDRLAGQRFRLDPLPEVPPMTVALSQVRRATVAAATGRLLLAAGAELADGPGPGVTSLRIPGPAATRTSAPGPLRASPSLTHDPQNIGVQTSSAPGSLPASPPGTQDPPTPSAVPIPPAPQASSAAPEAGTMGPLVAASAVRTPSVAQASSAALEPGTMEQLVAAVGPGAAWYALVSWPPGVPAEIDLAVWARRTSASPAWAVRHARQRITGLGGRVAAAGISLDGDYDPARPSTRTETALLSLLAEFPAVIAVAGRTGEPHRVARYLESVAAAWSACDEASPVLPRRGQPEPGLVRARLMLTQAAGTVLASGLRLLGVPD